MINLSQILTSIPDSPGFDDWQHRPMVVTNENYDQAFEEIKAKPVVGNLMIAVSGLYCLSLYAHRTHLNYLLVVDCGLRVNHFWGEIKKIVLESADRHRASGRINHLVLTQHARYFSGHNTISSEAMALLNITYQACEINSGISWLSDEGKYQRIKSHFAAGRIAFKQIDLYDPEATKHLGTMLKLCNLSVDLFYLSNIWEYAVQRKKLTLYTQGIKPLIDYSTFIIEAERREELLHQRIIQKKSDKLRQVLNPPTKK